MHISHRLILPLINAKKFFPLENGKDNSKVTPCPKYSIGPAKVFEGFTGIPSPFLAYNLGLHQFRVLFKVLLAFSGFLSNIKF